MKLYQYTLLVGDDVVDRGYIQASNEVQFEKRFKKEVYPHEEFDYLRYSEAFCECGSDEDVKDFYIGVQLHVKCRECRSKLVQSKIVKPISRG